MAAALGALGNDAVHPGLGHHLGQRDRGDHGEDLGPRLLPHGDIGTGAARAGGNDRHLLLGGDPGQFVGLGMHEHDVHAEGLIGQGTAQMDVLPEGLRAHAARADKAQGTRVRNGSGKSAGGDVGHAALDKGELGPQDLVEFHVNLPFGVGETALTTRTGRRPR